MDNITNYLIISMKRSGQHGVINWLGQQFENNTLHYNHCNKGWGNLELKPMHNNMVIYYDNINKNVTNYFMDYKIDPIKARSLETKLNNTKFNNIVSKFYNIEDLSLQEFMKNRMSSFKQMKNNGKVIIILRDPFNFIASCLQRKKNPTGPNGNGTDVAINIVSRLKTWVEHAKEIAKEQKLLDKEFYFINYNEWFSSEDYRKKICEDLGLKFTDRGLNSVVNYGHGSSFDREKFNGSAQSMNVLSRWENFKDDDFYKSLLTNEIIELSEKIFNFNPLKK